MPRFQSTHTTAKDALAAAATAHRECLRINAQIEEMDTDGEWRGEGALPSGAEPLFAAACDKSDEVAAHYNEYARLCGEAGRTPKTLGQVWEMAEKGQI